MTDHREAVANTLNAIRRILQAMRVAATDVQNRTGLSAAQLFVLHFLVDGHSLSINELADLTMTDRSSVADAVDRLAQRRLVKRAWSTQDRRRAAVTITAIGKKALERGPAPPTVWLLGGLERLNEAELQGLAVGLERLTVELDIRHDRPMMLFDGAQEPPLVRRRARKPSDQQRNPFRES